MYLKVHEGSGTRIVAVCDEGLVGKVLEEKGACMDLDRYRAFYVGKEAKESEVKKELGNFNSANIVGEKSVKVALSMGLAGPKDVMYIKKTPYIQIYRF